LPTFCHQKNVMRHFYASNAPCMAYAPQVGHPWCMQSPILYILKESADPRDCNTLIGNEGDHDGKSFRNMGRVWIKCTGQSMAG